MEKIMFGLMFIGVLLCRPVMDNDTYFLLAHGRYLAEYGIPFTEPLTIHEFPFIMQQWLSSLTFWGIYSLWGFNGLHIAVMAMTGIMIFCLFRLFLLISQNRNASMLVAMMSGMFIATMFSLPRPWMISYSLLLAEVCLLERFFMSNDSRWLFPLPLIAFLEINFHASAWPLCFVVMLPFAAEAALSSQAAILRHIAATVAVMLAFSLMNPYGADAMTYMQGVHTKSFSMLNYWELQPTDISTPSGKLFLLLILWSFYSCFRDCPIRYACFAAGFGLLAVFAYRGIFLFLLFGLLPIVYKLKDAEIQQKPFRKISLLLLIPLIIMCAGYCNLNVDDHPAKNAMNFLLALKQDTNTIRLFSPMDEGSYAEFLGIKTYIDTRGEIYLPSHTKGQDIALEYVSVITGHIPFRDVQEKYSFTHMLLPRKPDYPVQFYEKDWHIIYEDKYYRILEFSE